MAHSSKEEPKSAPQPDRWYNLTLGPSFKEDSSNNKFCTLRYEFKPASIDKSKAGSLHKNKDNRVSVEFQNNQLGKPRVTFEGSSEDYKDNDAVLFFDGQTFRMERLHRAVKQLRHLRVPGETAASAAIDPPGLSPPVAKAGKPANIVIGRSTSAFVNAPPVPVEVERIDIDVVDTQVPGPNKGISEHPSTLQNAPSPKNDDAEDHIDMEDIFGSSSPYDNTADPKTDGGYEPGQQRLIDTDDEIADVDDSGDEGDKGRNAAEALRAQVNAEERNEETSSSSSSSGSGSSGSGSASSSSSSGSEASDEVNSV